MSLSSLLVALTLSQTPALPVLTLEDALHEADTKSLELQVARTRLEQARLLSRKVWAKILPQIAAGASYTRNSDASALDLPTGFVIRNVGQPTSAPFDPTRPPGMDNPPGAPTTEVLVPTGLRELELQKYEQSGVQLQLTQPLIVPALWPAIRNAYLAEELAAVTAESARREVLFATAQLYYGVVGLKESVVVQERVLTLIAEHERQAQVRHASGIGPRIELTRARLDKARAEQDLQRSRNAWLSARHALATLLDRPDGFDVQRPEPTSSLDAPAPEVLQAAALDSRPDIMAARTGLELADRQHRAAWYKYAPAVGLTAQYRLANVKGFAGSYDTWAVSVGLSWTLWDGGLREAELEETELKTAEARTAVRLLENKARDEVYRAVLDVSSARASLTKAAEQLKLAREGMDLVQTSYDHGMLTYLDVTNAQSALLGAELGFVAETLNAQLAEVKLAKAMGTFGTSEVTRSR